MLSDGTEGYHPSLAHVRLLEPLAHSDQMFFMCKGKPAPFTKYPLVFVWIRFKY